MPLFRHNLLKSIPGLGINATQAYFTTTKPQMLYGYIRVSTDKQNVNNQRFEIQKFKERKNLPGKIERIEETVSGTKGYQKRKLGEVILSMTQ